MRIGHGFNNADANLYLNAQLAQGIRVSLDAVPVDPSPQ